MHRVIMGALVGEEVDHIDGDGLNNQRKNLRICSSSENKRNTRFRSNNTSGYRGVSWNIAAKKWQSTIGHNGRRRHLGYFDSKEEAAIEYDKMAARLHKEFASLNY